MSQKIRFVVVGASGIAHAHIQAIQNNFSAEVVGIFSRNFERAQEFARQYNIAAIKSYESILEDKSIDSVDIVSEPHRHAELALLALKHNKHVLVEKPIDVSVALAKKLLVESKKSPNHVSVISQKRFDDVILAMKEKVESGQMGSPLFAEVKLILQRPQEYYDSGNKWRGEYGNVLINQAIHWVDIGLWFFGAPIKINCILKKFKKNIQCYDSAFCNFEFKNGVILNLVCTTAAHKNQAEEFKIYCSEGVLTYSNEQKKISRFFKRLLRLPLKLSGRSFSPLQLQINDFVDAIKLGKSPAVSVSDGYAALKVVKKCEQVVLTNSKKIAERYKN